MFAAIPAGSPFQPLRNMWTLSNPKISIFKIKSRSWLKKVAVNLNILKGLHKQEESIFALVAKINGRVYQFPRATSKNPISCLNESQAEIIQAVNSAKEIDSNTHAESVTSLPQFPIQSSPKIYSIIQLEKLQNLNRPLDFRMWKRNSCQHIIQPIQTPVP